MVYTIGCIPHMPPRHSEYDIPVFGMRSPKSKRFICTPSTTPIQSTPPHPRARFHLGTMKVLPAATTRFGGGISSTLASMTSGR